MAQAEELGLDRIALELTLTYIRSGYADEDLKDSPWNVGDASGQIYKEVLKQLKEGNGKPSNLILQIALGALQQSKLQEHKRRDIADVYLGVQAQLSEE